MSRNIFYIPAICMALFSQIANASTNEILQCVKEGESAFNTIREKSISVGVHVGRGNPLPCKAKSSTKSITGEGAKSNEVIVGNPICKITHSNDLKRSNILLCAFFNNKPVLTLETHNKGCISGNSATANLKIKYKRIPTSLEKEDILKKCQTSNLVSKPSKQS